MLVTIAKVFLISMAVLAILGRLKWPTLRRSKAMKCAKCGQYLIANNPCTCDAPYRKSGE